MFYKNFCLFLYYIFHGKIAFQKQDIFALNNLWNFKITIY